MPKKSKKRQKVEHNPSIGDQVTQAILTHDYEDISDNAQQIVDMFIQFTKANKIIFYDNDKDNCYLAKTFLGVRTKLVVNANLIDHLTAKAAVTAICSTSPVFKRKREPAHSYGYDNPLPEDYVNDDRSLTEVFL